MELHDALRELVTAHGPGMMQDSAGFRGVLDDVLEEDQATTGEINLLVDAVRFDVLTSLDDLLSGGATPDRAVEETGARLARERGGDDRVSASWAAAVLGFAVGKVPEAVVLRYRSQRAPGTHRPPPTTAPPVQSPPPSWPPVQQPLVQQPPMQSPPTSWPQVPQQGVTTAPPGVGIPGAPYSSVPSRGFPPPRKRSVAVWVAAAVAVVVVIAGAIVAVVLIAGGGDDPSADDDGDKASPSATEATVDVEPDAIDERYDALAAGISTGAGECEAGTPTSGQSEVVDCTLDAATLQLVTWSDEAAFTNARETRLDYRAGTITQVEDASALYTFDPEPAGSNDAALVYWDSTAALQSATIRGEGGAEFDTVRALFDDASPRVSVPSGPGNEKLREFIGINMDIAGCTRSHTYFDGESEEDNCTADVDGVVVSVGRFTTREGLRKQRAYYKGEYDAASTQGGGGPWRFGEGRTEGAYYGYLNAEGTTATVYWDWNEAQCFCYGIAWSFDGKLKLVEDWWPSEE
ncbi:hypothetical protein ACFQ0K_02730 [Nocardioides caeni]|uniref:Uncharacterized protein n=1 Tax=Nocardioides caeni TaxID=574700 RepID=A0A4S8NP63_9ACTN|nr:hypothetical protein [Nocardioides caeni]THV18261.1 hypothetical protein E9934_01060 [Nocardioides caeni]